MEHNMKSYIISVAFILASIILLGFTTYSASMGVYCKDCGSEDNCWVGSGLDEGYQDCFIDENGQCSVTTWGDCEAYPTWPEEN